MFLRNLVDFHRITWRYIPENVTLHSHRCENLKSNKLLVCYSQGECQMHFLLTVCDTSLSEFLFLIQKLSPL
jgi:hypothetical protein